MSTGTTALDDGLADAVSPPAPARRGVRGTQAIPFVEHRPQGKKWSHLVLLFAQLRQATGINLGRAWGVLPCATMVG